MGLEQIKNQKAILGSQCLECQTITYPPRLICPTCRSRHFIQVDIPIEGKIFSYTTINIPLVNYNNPPYILALIYFENNTQLKVTARLEMPEGKDPAIDQKVQLSIKTFSESKMTPILVAKVL